MTIGTSSPFLARHEGSFFGLRAAVEPIVAADQPEPLILYLPGIAKDRQGPVLMELEQAETCYNRNSSGWGSTCWASGSPTGRSTRC